MWPADWFPPTDFRKVKCRDQAMSQLCALSPPSARLLSAAIFLPVRIVSEWPLNSDIDSHPHWYKRSVGSIGQSLNAGRTDSIGCREHKKRRWMFLGERSGDHSTNVILT